MTDIDNLFSGLINKNDNQAQTKSEVKSEVKEAIPSAPQQQTTANPPITLKEEEDNLGALVYTIYGQKGVGKTTLALAFPGEILAFSFDRKTAIVKKFLYNNDPRIHVYDIIKGVDYSTPEQMLKTADETYDAFVNFLKNYNGKVDFIVIDDAADYQELCEWKMRYRHKLDAFSGFANLNFWKERNKYMTYVHSLMLNIAKKGIIYTTYTDKDETIVNGNVLTKKDIPKWVGIVLTNTDVVLKVYIDDGQRKLLVESSKNDNLFKTGTVYTINTKEQLDNTIKQLLKNI